MFAPILDWSLRSRALVIVLALALLAVGAREAWRLPVDVLPDLTRPTVTVQIEAAGLAPEDVESQVAYPLETALAGLPGISRLRSVSAPGLALITVEFDWDSDPYRSRQFVAERIDAARAQLPDGVQPRIAPLASLMGEILLVALQSDSDDVSPRALRDHADWVLRPALLGVPGVAQVIDIGGEVRQYEVRPDPERLRQLGVTLDELENATRGYGRDLASGYADAGGRELTLRSLGRPFDPEQLRQVAVAQRGAAVIRVGQVAEIAEGSRLKRGEAGANGRPAVILAVQKQPGVDTLPLTLALEAHLRKLDAALPEGVHRTTVFRQADFIRHSIRNVSDALRDGAIIVALVLLLFLASGRASLIALLAIPLSMMAAILALRWAGLSINTMTLGGLAIAVGELVDDAVVGIENVVRRLRHRGPADAGALNIVGRATLEVRSAILHATLLIVLVFLPLFALGGVEGRLFAPLAIAYIAAIAASLVVAITVTPVLCLLAFDRTASLPREPRWLAVLKARYTRVLARVLANSPLLFSTTALLLVAALLATLSLPRAFLPPFNEGTLTVNLLAQPGISLVESDRLGRIAENLLMAVPDVTGVGRRTGRAEQDEHAEGLHYSELDVALREGGRSRADVVADIRARLAVLPAQVSVGQPISHRLDHLLSGVRAPLVVKIAGEDLGVLRTLAEDVRTRLARIEGLSDVQVEAQTDTPQMQIRIDARAAAQYGISPARAQDAVAALTVGRRLSQIVEGERRYDLVLRLPEAQRGPEALQNLLIDGSNGPVPLGWIASFETGAGPNQILREQLHRRIVVTANAGTGRFDLAGGQAERELAKIDLPPGYDIRIEGQAAAQRQALKRIGGLAGLSLLLMFAMLYGRYGSARLALIVLGNVPLALIGGVVALAITQTPLSVASLIGFVSLAGIAVRNGILKLSHYLHLIRIEGEPFGPGLVLRGSSERLTPVLMTALIAALALTPLLWGGDAPGKEILHPVALVIFSGLISGTLLDSFLTPALFLRYGSTEKSLSPSGINLEPK